jgi:hypothetical protein
LAGRLARKLLAASPKLGSWLLVLIAERLSPFSARCKVSARNFAI